MTPTNQHDIAPEEIGPIGERASLRPPEAAASDWRSEAEAPSDDFATLDEEFQNARTIVQDLNSALGQNGSPQEPDPWGPTDAATIDATTPAAAISTPSAFDSESLREIDQSLADELDELLDGDFETIDAVLQGSADESSDQAVFTSAAARAAMDAPPMTGRGGGERDSMSVVAMAPRPMAPQVLASDESALADADGAESSSAGDEVAAATVGIAPEQAAPPQAEKSQAEPLSLSAELENNRSQQAIFSDAADAASMAFDAAAGELDDELHDGASTFSATADFEGPDAAPEALPRRRLNWGGFVTSALRPLARALSITNLPLRLMPPKLRPMVNWIAVSLLAWVPAVWLMSSKISRHHSSSASATSAVVGESSNDAASAQEQAKSHSQPGPH